MNMKIDPSLFNDKNVENSEPEHNIPPIVLAAIGVLSLIFLSGALYLFLSGPFIGIDILEPAQLPSTVIAVRSFSGPLWEMEKERKKVKILLQERGLLIGDMITVFKKSPYKMRPIKVMSEVGYILGLGIQSELKIKGVIIKRINPGRRLVVKVDGAGNYSGNKAYKSAEKLLASKGLAPAEGERYEVKRGNENKKTQIEHWIPVK